MIIDLDTKYQIENWLINKKFLLPIIDSATGSQLIDYQLQTMLLSTNWLTITDTVINYQFGY